MVPIGFVSDHMEVVYDLDTEALATAEKLGLPATRAATAGVDPRFVATVRDLLLERAAVERGEDVARASRRRLAGRAGTAARSAAAPTRAPSGRRSPGSTRDRLATPSWPRSPSTPPAQAAALVRDRAARPASRSPPPSPATSTSSPRPTAPARR